ncbi:hypothetical protein K437DRAFT_108468 [Tilletiaria anomala UBC 951]|uniref:Uncharacterized protein n=1 Tax=Tilletiaria anomala (strain ATCC 24038 / CBS 436.72 / UBC 951) TaxID=1037660 RepID=A0A066W5B2_TILAU|nr:uncharacterized protein K437DRAFT_108468 [Tilletiaria anomala UBC 951]KDN46264.1 hypothetical protein K437DRAFT_108468 [Tilletiaria anomala UBC 951]
MHIRAQQQCREGDFDTNLRSLFSHGDRSLGWRWGWQAALWNGLCARAILFRLAAPVPTLTVPYPLSLTSGTGARDSIPSSSKCISAISLSLPYIEQPSLSLVSPPFPPLHPTHSIPIICFTKHPSLQPVSDPVFPIKLFLSKRASIDLSDQQR